MKITLQKIDTGEEEILIRYREMTREISHVMKLFSGTDDRLAGVKEEGEQQYYFTPEEVYYFESVDGHLYAYLETDVYRLRENLEAILEEYAQRGIVRCARTMAVNLYQVEWLKSQSEGRILASLRNGEQIVISRRYAGELRRQLRKGAGV